MQMKEKKEKEREGEAYNMLAASNVKARRCV